MCEGTPQIGTLRGRHSRSSAPATAKRSPSAPVPDFERSHHVPVFVGQEVTVPHVVSRAVEVRNDAGHLTWQRHDGVFRFSWCGQLRWANEFHVAELPPLKAAAVVIFVVLGNDGPFERLSVQDLEFDQMQVDRVSRHRRVVYFPNFACI